MIKIIVTFLFQDDKDLVHEFVNSDGLNALITVGTDADQNYQNYILRGKPINCNLLVTFLLQTYVKCYSL